MTTASIPKSLASSAAVLLKKAAQIQKASIHSGAARRLSSLSSVAISNQSDLLEQLYKSPLQTIAETATVSTILKEAFGQDLLGLQSISESAPVSNRHGAGIVKAASGKDIHLPPSKDPFGLQLYKKASYCSVTHVLKTSLHMGTNDENQNANGVVGRSVSPAEARNHARNAGLQLLATVIDFVDGDLERIEKIVKLRGLVKAAPGFVGHEDVINGCSDVLADALGSDIVIGTQEWQGYRGLGSTVACELELKVRPLE
jgi:hypothetical protein